MLDTTANSRLMSLIKILSKQTGGSYFESLVVNLSQLIPMKYVFIGVLTENKKSIKTIAFAVNGKLHGNIEYELKNSPFENVMNNKTCWHTKDAQKLFSKDHLLVEMKINSYIGFPLQDIFGATIGIMGLLDEKELYADFENDRLFLETIQLLVGSELSRHLSELKLKEREENYRVTLESIGDAVIVTNPNKEITHMNPIAEDLTGYLLADVAGKSIHSVLRLSSEKDGKAVSYSIKGNFAKTKFTLLNKNDKIKHITCSSSPIYNDKKNLVGEIIVFHDITKEFEMETQYRHTQKMEAIGQLAGGIAHDFNNILTGIIGCANILQRKSNDPKTVEKYSTHIINAAKRTSDLTRKLLDFSRKGKLLSTELDIHEVIKDTLQMLNQSIYKGIEIKTIFNAKNSILKGDPSQLENSILNILLNACDAMNNIGELTIKTVNLVIENPQMEQLELSGSSQFIEIEIQDNGSGIPPEVLPKIFEPFFTTKEIGKGTGLGLAAVFGAIKDHQGAIQVWSEVGVGTKFSILLPLHTSNGITVASNETQSITSKNNLIKVLLVDDEYLIRHSIKVLLEENQFKTFEASNGEEAISLFDLLQNEINFVILDLIMPKINGIAVYHHIRKKYQNIPILFISGFKKEASDLPQDPKVLFLQKPFEEKDLMNSIKQLQLVL